MEIEQTHRPLETNAHAKFPMAENAAYQWMKNGGGKRAHIDMFVAHCSVWYNVVRFLCGREKNIGTYGYT